MKTMTLDDFLAALEEITKRGHRAWELNGGCITSVEDELCPIHEVWLDSEEGEEMLEDWGAEADRLGLRPSVAQAIVMAADGKGKPALRAKLLAACGIT